MSLWCNRSYLAYQEKGRVTNKMKFRTIEILLDRCADSIEAIRQLSNSESDVQKVHFQEDYIFRFSKCNLYMQYEYCSFPGIRRFL